jgi:NagD protein
MVGRSRSRNEAHSETTVMVGDRMGTDVVAGIEAGLYTVLVLTGSTRPSDIDRFPLRAAQVFDSIADVIPHLRRRDGHAQAG